MTKKRFVKCLMGKGISRNNANQIAADYCWFGMPYCMAIVDYDFGIYSTTLQNHRKTIRFLVDEVEEIAGIRCKTAEELKTTMLEIGKARF